MTEMKDEKETKDGQETTQDPVTDTAAEPQNTDTSPDPVPYNRFKEVNERAKTLAAEMATLREKLEKQETEAERRRKQELKDQEKYKELAEEMEGKVNDLEPRLKTEQERAQLLEQKLAEYADSQMDLVPEVYRDILKALPVVDRIDWLTQNREKLAQSKPSGIPSTPEGKGAKPLNDEERRRRAPRTF